MHARFLGKDPESHIDGSPTLFATDRTDRKTYIGKHSAGIRECSVW